MLILLYFLLVYVLDCWVCVSKNTFKNLPICGFFGVCLWVFVCLHVFLGTKYFGHSKFAMSFYKQMD